MNSTKLVRFRSTTYIIYIILKYNGGQSIVYSRGEKTFFFEIHCVVDVLASEKTNCL